MKKTSKLLAFLLCAAMLVCTLPMFAFAKDKDFVAAQWDFNESALKSGSIDKSNLVFADQSGNGNDLVLKGGNAKKYLEFTDEKMYDGTSGSLKFNNQKQRVLGQGCEFVTADGAPINSETFQNGYTIELIYQLPADYSEPDSWMGLLARKGKCVSMDETKKCSMSLAVSNCKELQFLTANKDDSHEMDPAAWSIAMDKGSFWYHLVITSDNHTISTHINGCESFRDYVSDEMVGMFADPNDGRFVVGGYDNGIFNHHGRGTIQQVRISNRALDRSEWLISDYSAYMVGYGENLPYTKISDTAYNVIFLPDIQNATEFRNNVINTAANWLNDNREYVNAAAIVGLGDNVNTYYDEEQWKNALEFYSILQKGEYKILQQPGNHDYGDDDNGNAYYLNAFGKDSDFGKWQSERGTVYSPSGYSSYTFFDGGSYRYLALSISMYHIDDEAERAWFEKILQDNKDCPTIVTSHSFQDCNAAKPDQVVLNGRGESIWEIVKKYNQVFLMISGHNHGAGEEVLLNEQGNEVFSIMADYQFSYNGGNAYFKFAEFDEANNRIALSTFSPYAATLKDGERTPFDVNYMTGAGNYTIMEIDFQSRFAGMKASDNAESYKESLKNTKSDGPLFTNPKTVSKADGRTVSASAKISPVILAVIIAAAAVIVIIVIVVTVVIVKKRRRAK